ncbi:GTP pyrophosphokinase family protein [Streptomyces sp. NPDC017890]|uniref:GTP pyrophosphokinase family protein n=1 Tax=Streptomyces sp. NPDC017890 TaxID=3365015 RepID=UPI00378827D7
MASEEQAEIRKQFSENELLYQDLRTEILHCLQKEFSAPQSVKIHSITARIKTIDSFLEKVIRKSYASPFEQAEDIVGARVVCLFLADLSSIKDALRKTFDVISEEDKVNEGEVSSFGYMSHHFICRLSSAHSGPRYDTIKGIRFEVQVRTILMDAWANISHYLAYKNEESIPADLVRDFHALSGLLYVADRQFQNLNRDAVHSAVQAEHDIIRSRDILSSAINADTVAALFRRQQPDRTRASEKDIAEFISELLWIDLNDLRDLARILQENNAAALRYEKKNPPAGSTRFGDVGLARIALAIHSPEYAEAKYPKNKGRYAEFRGH